jgi:hypothetical protein
VLLVRLQPLPHLLEYIHNHGLFLLAVGVHLA